MGQKNNDPTDYLIDDPSNKIWQIDIKILFLWFLEFNP